jgi:L-lactate dehydrogenase complex protein LldG
VRKEQIVYSSVSVFRRLAAGPMPSQVIFKSGPSRSSDIENDLSIGVHGPGHLHVILL